MAPEVTIRAWNRRRDRSEVERWPAPDLPAHWSQVRDCGPGERASWAIDAAGELVGRLSLRGINRDQATLGIYLRPDKYGQGIGTAALLAFREQSPVNFLVADVALDNFRARRCYQKAGFLWIQTIEGFAVLGLYVAPYRVVPDGAILGAVH